MISRTISMDSDLLPPPGQTTGEAMALQLRLRDRVVATPPEAFSPQLVAGADLSIVRGRDLGHAAIVVLEVGNLRPVAEATASVEVDFPYVPGLLSFRELPPLAAAWEKLEVKPDLILFDAHGLAHPRRFGLACHGGLLFDLPAIGVAKSILVGQHGPLGDARGSTAPLRHEGEDVGVAVRTRAGVAPIYVSVGHRIDLPAAVAAVLNVSPCYRIPEPIRRAHRLCNAVRSGTR
jgi:deoxyribonuclease V